MSDELCSRRARGADPEEPALWVEDERPNLLGSRGLLYVLLSEDPPLTTEERLWCDELRSRRAHGADPEKPALGTEDARPNRLRSLALLLLSVSVHPPLTAEPPLATDDRSASDTLRSRRIHAAESEVLALASEDARTTALRCSLGLCPCRSESIDLPLATEDRFRSDPLRSMRLLLTADSSLRGRCSSSLRPRPLLSSFPALSSLSRLLLGCSSFGRREDRLSRPVIEFMAVRGICELPVRRTANLTRRPALSLGAEGPLPFRNIPLVMGAEYLVYRLFFFDQGNFIVCQQEVVDEILLSSKP